MPIPDTDLHRTLEFEWSRMDTPKDMCLVKEIGVCAQNMITILGSIVSIIRGT